MNYEQGSILLVPFPFTNLTTNKKRPVLVLSKTEDNEINDDLVLCAITSKTKKTPFSLIISQDNLKEGSLPLKSQILISKIFTIEKTLIIKEFAKMSNEMFQKVRDIFYDIV